MALEEVNIISHLLEIEQNAYLKVKEAQEEANKSLAEARAEADAKFNAEYEKMALNLEQNFNLQEENTRKIYRNELKAFTDKIEGTELNKKEFFSFLDKVLK